MKEKVRNNKIFKLIMFFPLILLLIIFSLSVFINNYFDEVSFEQLLYNTINSKGADLKIVLYGIVYIVTIITFLSLIVYLTYKLYNFIKIKVVFKLQLKNKILKFSLFEQSLSKIIIFYMLFAYILSISSIKLLNIDEYINSQKSSSKIYEEYYVDAHDVDIKFPEEKRNLIYIFVESLESSNVSKKNGGIVDESYIPNLETIALENINFSHNEKIGGAIEAPNTGWTIAGMVAQTSGIPLKLSIDGNSYKGYKEFLAGVYNLGDILKDNGYENYLMIGSDADFGGRRDYFSKHGQFEIYDYNYAKKTKLIPKNYEEWWGYEDKKLFDFAKDKIKEISKLDKPFNFTMLTADTHFPDGFLDKTCTEVFDIKYANSFYCSDKKIKKFIDWIKNQDFYKNTTIAIIGDHLTMQNGFYNDLDEGNRKIYNVFLNSAVESNNYKNRLFSPLDIYPTTLASLGVEIDGNKLGLGVNLFSKEKTLYEQLGVDYVNEELAKKSFFYDNNLLGDTYFKMQENK